MNRAVKTGDGAELDDGLLKFGDLEVKKQERNLICYQRQYL